MVRLLAGGWQKILAASIACLLMSAGATLADNKAYSGPFYRVEDGADWRCDHANLLQVTMNITSKNTWSMPAAFTIGV
jgi:hypothetical protein